MANYVWGYPGMWGYSHGVPYNNFHELNLDWVLAALQKFNADLKEVPTEIARQLKEALDQMEFDQIIAEYLAKSGVVNVKLPPTGLTPASGDGTTDDTATIQGCIDYLAMNGGGTVFIPNGQYLTEPLELKDHVSIVGMDRYSTDLVLKGGATRALIHGDVAYNSIRDIHLNGNSTVQPNHVDVVELTAGELLIDNVLINNGYELLSLVEAGGTWQLTNIVFENAGLAAVELIAASGSNLKTNVVAENWHVGYVSSINGQIAVNNGISDAVFTDIFIDTVVPTGFNCGGSYCKFVGQIIGAVTPYVDLGEMNSFTLIGLSESVKFSGTKKVQAGAIERDSETVISDAAQNIMSNAQEKNTISGTDVVLAPINPITYKTPDESMFYNTVPAKSTTGSAYNIMIENPATKKMGATYNPNLIKDIDTNSNDNAEAFQNLASNVGLYEGIYKIASNCVISANLQIPMGAVISVSAGTTVVIRGYINAGRYKIFEGEGNVKILNATVFPEWFGAEQSINSSIDCTNAFQKSIDCIEGAGIISLAPSENNIQVTKNAYSYFLENVININKSHVTIKGNYATITAALNFLNIGSDEISYMEEIEIDNLYVFSGNIYTNTGIYNANTSRVTINNVNLFGFLNGYVFNNTVNTTVSNSKVINTSDPNTLTPTAFTLNGTNASIRLNNDHCTDGFKKSTGFLLNSYSTKDCILNECECASSAKGIVISYVTGRPSEGYDIFIKGCILDGCIKGIEVNNFTTGGQINITDNWINLQTNKNTETTAGIEVNSTYLANISNNQIKSVSNNNAAFGIVLNASNACIIANNTIAGCTNPITCGGESHTICNNVYFGGGNYTAPQSADTQISITGNKCVAVGNVGVNLNGTSTNGILVSGKNNFIGLNSMIATNVIADSGSGNIIQSYT